MRFDKEQIEKWECRLPDLASAMKKINRDGAMLDVIEGVGIDGKLSKLTNQELADELLENIWGELNPLSYKSILIAIVIDRLNSL